MTLETTMAAASSGTEPSFEGAGAAPDGGFRGSFMMSADGEPVWESGHVWTGDLDAI